MWSGRSGLKHGWMGAQRACAGICVSLHPFKRRWACGELDSHQEHKSPLQSLANLMYINSGWGHVSRNMTAQAWSTTLSFYRGRRQFSLFYYGTHQCSLPATCTQAIIIFLKQEIDSGQTKPGDIYYVHHP